MPELLKCLSPFRQLENQMLYQFTKTKLAINTKLSPGIIVTSFLLRFHELRL